MRYIKGFGRFWYDFVIGDDWKIAATVVAALALTLAGVATGIISAGAAAPVGAVLVAMAFTAAMVAEVRRHE